ncbi:MAG: tRNA adenosine(34) deaminase TadA [Gammaproteobacteria bacterium]|jgi:tRNA(adenine34) deaminase|nr:tRNA adenosine(34) deaminase TadA [Gammaproteobacteria bacterium]|tara:strand:- start:7113 stop:7580 length:468 start_codon:yes stop_codon:yes gene_type:complete
MTTNHCDKDHYWMQLALEQAALCAEFDEVPVGALVVQDGQLLARCGNRTVSGHDPCAHAEVLALREAASSVQNYRLTEATLYVTLEPCMMCAGAILAARVKRLVFAAYDLKTGAVGGCFNWLTDSKHTHKVQVLGGVMELQSAELLQQFFKNKRG